MWTLYSQKIYRIIIVSKWTTKIRSPKTRSIRDKIAIRCLVPRAALALSDHCMLHLIPTYRQKLKCAKPVVRTMKRWTVE